MIGTRALRAMSAAAVLLAAVTGCGAGSGGTSAAAPSSSPSAQQTEWPVDGERVHLDCTGTGAPTVLLLAGAGDPSTTWYQLRPKIGTRTCAYDYPGVGASTSRGGQMSTRRAVTALEHVLAAAAEKGPYVVVGHSIAGLETRLFVGENAEAVTGVVLFDPTTAEYAEGPGRAGLATRANWAVTSGAQAAAVTRWPDIPVRVLGRDPQVALVEPSWSPALQQLWSTSQRALARLSPHGTYTTVPGSTHYVYRDDVDGSVRAITEVLAAAR